MANDLFKAATMRLPAFTKELLAGRDLTTLELDPSILGRIKPSSPPPPVTPAPTALPASAVPVAPANNPFEGLPFPAPGDRIKADDFKKLSQGLSVIADAFMLSGSLFGRAFGEARQLLGAQQYVVTRVMSVFGSELDNINDATLDTRRVIQVIPIKLGERNVAVVLTEAVETRRFAPNLLGLTYSEASERLRAILGEITFPTSPMNASQLVGLSLNEAIQKLSK